MFQETIYVEKVSNRTQPGVLGQLLPVKNDMLLQGLSVGKESACNPGDLGSIPVLGRFPGEGNDNSLQYSCLENPMDREVWQVIFHGVTRVRHDLASNHHQGHGYFLHTCVLSYFTRSSRYYQVVPGP